MTDEGAEHELEFWRGFVLTERFKDWIAPKPTPELRSIVREFLVERPFARVLDVGSGVVSLLHGTVPQDRLVAADPLATEYATFFDYREHGIEPPIQASAEDLSFHGEFDVVHMSNALDHSGDPVRAMEGLFRAVKPGGWVIVQTFEDEGRHQGYAGLHQWDLRIDEDGRTLLARDREGAEYDLGSADRVWRLLVPHMERHWVIWMRQCRES